MPGTSTDNWIKSHPDSGYFSPTLYIHERSKQLENEGRHVFKLGFGQSPFPVPEIVVEALKKEAHRKEYLPVQGLPELRESVSNYYNQNRGWSVRESDVMIGPGSKELIFLSQLVLDHHLILPNPSWVSYAPQAKLLGRKIHWVKTYVEDNYNLKALELEKACSEIKGPKLLVLNYPNNPTGNGYSVDELKELSNVANQHNLTIISDEIYSRLQFSDAFTSIAEYYPTKTIITSGLSKWCGAGGWRLGTMLFPLELQEFKSSLIAAASETFSCVSAPIQYAAVTAYKGCQEIDHYLDQSNKILKHVSSYIIERLSKKGILCSRPVGGFYTFLSFEKFRFSLEQKGILTGRDLCSFLLNEYGIALLPGHVFGRPEEELTARLCYVDFDGKRILESDNWVEEKESIIMSKYFPKLYDATNLFIEFADRL